MAASETLKTLTALANSPPEIFKDEDRLAALAACTKLQERLESPLETFLRFMFGGLQGMVLRVGVETKILQKAVEAKGPIEIVQLAASTSADPDLVRRIVRILAAMKLFEETGEDVYLATPLAGAFVAPSPLESAVLHIGSSLPTVASIPEYLAEKGYHNPNDAFDGPWQYTNRTNDHYFDWVAKRPVLQQAFNTVMTISRMERGEEWFEFFPVKDRLKVRSPDDTLLVDIGGGVGHDAIAFKKHFPDLPGRLIVEDLPVVIADAKDMPDGIELLGHSFFNEQPQLVHKARAYYLRTVLHDWPDKQARVILENIRNVMAKESILLINENSLPAAEVPLYPAQLDILMMACFSSLDRTEKQFAQLLDSAGFELVHVWRPKVMLPGTGVLFEAVMKG
ncbi:S-adenosyl-L-methionine-dependent methyltransferase [Massariosphaeria phaeospora]|uniref:S-adenosyl-L-methionine-dependent methyltransferase n=1 Tax=Massariosphaeria phaeospora TaxID=100035 RepID=A0A7C8M8V3_9PLEO|nr:S-adenosyl-L-methionine-dependent methyltransferase [Massariosphaeria phaeospora]